MKIEIKELINIEMTLEILERLPDYRVTKEKIEHNQRDVLFGVLVCSSAWAFDNRYEIKYTREEKLEYKINYKHSLMLSGEKNYKEANKLLAPYEKAYPKSKRLMIANMMALSSIEFYDNQEKGWEALKSNPKEALRYFSKNCETNATNECQEGMMYSYSKIGKPIQSTFWQKNSTKSIKMINISNY
ncbi:MAG: hypothetical protein Q9M39_08480 [Sulfurovum sp.]|nr:hypothetical protein [Sulfurovum sp.]